ncbi:MAG TPA: DUF4416 family protein, partial [bacterium (Candidatus Stahlbacteria)]|nr:DUF4416 family protein [Candidatus Stahlbacteria bacterium]
MVAIPFFGLIYQKVETLNRAIDMVGSLFDEQPVLSNESPFDITDYYEPEFGRDLKRRWCGFGESIPADQILNLKLKSINFEQELAENGKRTVNIDPGIIQLNRVVLATHKDAAHRI